MSKGGEYQLAERKQRIVHTNRYMKLLRIGAIVLAIVLLASALAYGWQKYDEKKYPEGTEKNYKLPNAFVNFAKLVTNFIDEHNAKEPNENVTTEDSENDDEITFFVVGKNGEVVEVADNDENVPEVVVERGGIVEETKPANESEFDNSLFVGDWFVSGFSKKYFSVSKMAYQYGYDLNAFISKKIFEKDGYPYKAIDYINSFENLDSIYIMFSPESISWMDCQTFEKKYTAFLNDIMESHPDMNIYIQEILPILTEEAKKRDYTVTNDKIDEINRYIYEFCEENDLWYLDIAESFKDEETGELISDYTTNGIRLNEDAYAVWYNYIITHRVG